MIWNGNITLKTKGEILMNVSDIFVHITWVNRTPKLQKGQTCSLKLFLTTWLVQSLVIFELCLISVCCVVTSRVFYLFLISFIFNFTFHLLFPFRTCKFWTPLTVIMWTKQLNHCLKCFSVLYRIKPYTSLEWY